MKYKFLKFFVLAILMLISVSYFNPTTVHGLALCSEVVSPRISISTSGGDVPYGQPKTFTVYTYAEPSSRNSISYPGGSFSYTGPSSAGRTYTTSVITNPGQIFVWIEQNCDSDPYPGPTDSATVYLNPVIGACSSPSTHYSCAKGTSVNNIDGASAYTWNCNGLNNSTASDDVSCSETKPLVNGGCADDQYNCTSPAPSTNNVNGASEYTWTCPGSNGGRDALCIKSKTPIDGGWSAWSSWSACSVTACGQTGTQTSTRTCTNPTPANGGANCSLLDGGNSSKTQTCSTPVCPTGTVNGGWSAWSACSVTACGSTGTQTRTCTNPTPANGGADCSLLDGGNSSQSCSSAACIVNGLCSAAHYNCTQGTSANPDVNFTAYTWNCNGSNGGTNVSCSEAKSQIPIDGFCADTHNDCISGLSVDTTDTTTLYKWACNGSGGGVNELCSEAKSFDLTASTSSTPLTAAKDVSLTLSAYITNIGNSTLTSNTTFSNFFQVCNVGGGCVNPADITELTSVSMSGFDVTYQKTTSQSYTFTSVGTYSVRACADLPPQPNGVIAESNEGNNCSAWRDVIVTEGSTNIPPTGYFDVASCTDLQGWAYDPDTSSTSTNVEVYKEGGVFVGVYLANGSRPDVNTAFGITGNHGFVIPTPSSLKDGVAHSLSVYAVDATGGPSTLTGASPKSITCAPVMSGTLTASNCTIDPDQSSCTSTLNWSTTNPVGVSGVTSNTPVADTPIGSGNSGTTTATVSYSSRDFFLYNNEIELARATPAATCVSGTSWDGIKCVTNPPPPPAVCGNGVIETGEACDLGAGNGACPATCSTSCTTNTCGGGGGGAVNGSCTSPAVHYTCATGTSTNNISGISSFTWTCAGSGGGTNASCSEPKKKPVIIED